MRRKPGPVLLDPLPFGVRVRLWAVRRIDLTATWLTCHVHWRAGKLLWQLSGRW